MARLPYSSPERVEINKRVIAEFRANAGFVGGNYQRYRLVLLHTKGAKTRLERINPLASLRIANTLYVFASKGGEPTNPDWYYNLVAEPNVVVEYGSETFDARATVLDEEQREAIYAEQVRLYPHFHDFQVQANRTIPVIALNRKTPNL